MARRTNGTALRYEFQLFDDDSGQGRAIADAIAAAQIQGISAAEFIRRALAFYVQNRTPKALPAPADSHILRKLSELEARLVQPPPAPAYAVVGHSPLETSSGLDMSRPRKRPGPPKPLTLPEVPAVAVDADEARRQLLASIKAYGKEFHRGH